MNSSSPQATDEVDEFGPDDRVVDALGIPSALVKSALDEGIAAHDFWAVMTVVGTSQMRPDNDAALIRDLIDSCGGVDGKRVADLGSGCGRYAAEIHRRGASEVVGFETSGTLRRISRALHPAVRVVGDSLSDIGVRGAFDVVVALSHILFINESRDGLRSDLRNIRSAMPDFGVIVVEQFSITAGERVWAAVEGTSITEQCHLADESLVHRFVVRRDGTAIFEEQMKSLLLTDDEFEEIARDAGFLVSARRSDVTSSGEKSELWVLRAQKGFNYLSDIDSFLESWLEGDHERNRLSRSLVADADGRVRPEGTFAWGQGASVSRNHPEFLECLEPAVTSLVVELVTEWNLVTYSSCDGHRVSREPCEDYTECYVGVVSFSDVHEQALVKLFETVCAELATDTAHPRVRQRPLLGPRSKHPAVDLLINRRGPHVTWANYQVERDRLVHSIVQRLRRMRLEN